MNSQLNDSVLVVLSDESYLEAAKQVFVSAHIYGGWKGDYCLMAFEVSSDKLAPFKKKGIFLHNVEIFDSTMSRKNQVIYSKLSIFKKDFHVWRNVVFLDCDMIVQKNICALAEIEGVAGVRGWSKPTIGHRVNPLRDPINGVRLKNEIDKKFNLKSPAVNGGLIAYRTSDVQKDSFEKMISIYSQYKAILQAYDEFLISAFFKEQLTLLPHIFDCMNHEHKWITQKAIILHFSGDRKPWKESSSFFHQWKQNNEQFETTDYQLPLISSQNSTILEYWLILIVMQVAWRTNVTRGKLAYYFVVKPIKALEKIKAFSKNKL